MTLCSSNIFNNSNTSALDYSSNVGIGFTFNPTLSISLSSNDLVISNLVPGSIEDSNSINVSIATNAAYGYTLSANVGDDIHNNSNLTHTNNTNIFSSIAIDADLSSLDEDEDTNIWGYSYKDNTVVSPAWSNYNGLTNSNNSILLDTSSNVSNNIGFKIAAKASNTQPSGVYTGTINFYAITKPTPITLSEAYASEGKTMINGYYTMQDMTPTICDKTEAIGAQLQVLDIRDNKLYWISKLADNHCWMTQNLDLDLDSNRTYTHWDTDLGWSTEGGSTIDEDATWRPMYSTANLNGDTIPDWTRKAHSANPGDVYYYTSNTEADDIKYNSLQECINAEHIDCAHYHAGNYYTWEYTIAESPMTNIQFFNAPNSVCPSSWRLPIATDKTQKTEEFNALFHIEDIASNGTYNKNGFVKVRKSPVYLVRAGQGYMGNFQQFGASGNYWSSTDGGSWSAYHMFFDPTNTNGKANWSYKKRRSYSVRCLAR